MPRFVDLIDLETSVSFPISKTSPQIPFGFNGGSRVSPSLSAA